MAKTGYPKTTGPNVPHIDVLKRRYPPFRREAVPSNGQVASYAGKRLPALDAPRW
jgi:hypothetical protein